MMSRVFSQRFRSSIPRVEGDERSTDTSALFFYFLPFVSFRTVAIHLLVIIGERRRACDRATMEMHILPFVVPLVPYAALLALVGVRYSLSEKICNRIFSNLCKFSGFVLEISNF